MNTIRPPAVAGLFYPAEAALLQSTVDQLLGDALVQTAKSTHPAQQPKALIVPHAGYIYSGSTAARAYAELAPWRHSIHRVILLGPTHRVAVNGLALPETDTFATPLGKIPVDPAARAAIIDLPQICSSDRVHAQEHSLEVHLPFLQRGLDDFTLLPLAVGEASPEDVAEVIDRLWGGPETLFVISSDLSHFLPYATAQAVDRKSCGKILALDTTLHPEQACGAFPINGLLLAARQRGLQPRQLALCNSGDTAGERSRVVGYASFALYEPNESHHG
ncbi:AmmeMemoRadiSam system protein B [Azonexus sp.]|uniref:AmmeMemoRadiSam system protein B n=1 Tax=Azonexus sp. TaxID=1872668 RepID=UPI0035A0A49F